MSVPTAGSPRHGLVLQLAAPLQSWGEHSTFSERDTGRHPTRSGLIGLLASALGLARGDVPDELRKLRFTIRIDRPGLDITDFHTVGGGFPPAATVVTAEGGHRSGNTATLVSRRHYLSDAVFTIAVTGQPDTVSSCADALRAPVWAPYLGRRSCPPTAALLVHAATDQAEDELHRIPLARPRPRNGSAPDADGTVRVTFISEHADGTDQAVTLLNDEPLSFHPRDRRYGARPSYRSTLDLPASLCGGYGTAYLTRLTAYLNGDTDEAPDTADAASPLEHDR